MAKKLAGTMKLQVPAGQANPSPPVGPALGQRGINIMEFCKAFNAKTQDMEPGAPCPTVITYYQDKSFTMDIKTPPASYYLKKAAKLKSGANNPGRETVGSVTAAAGERNRRSKNERPERERHRCCNADHPGLGTFHGHRGEVRWQSLVNVLPQRVKRSLAKTDVTVEEAVALVKGNATAKFDETVEIAVNLGVDPRHADQMVRGVVGLPNGTGKSVRVAVFARGPKAEEAQAAGADIVGAEDLMETVQGGTIEFDRCIATPDMMPIVGRLGKVLGPRNLMPNPKVGTVTMDVESRPSERQGR